MSVMSDFNSLMGSQDDRSVHAISKAIENIRLDSPRAIYSKLRNEREQATFNLMMRMAPSSLSSIRHEFYNRQDSVSLNEFIYIMSKHLLSGNNANAVVAELERNRNFVSDMHELFKEVDVNGDGQMEWEEFTKFTVEKASLLNKRFVLTTIPEYLDTSASLDASAKMRRRNDISYMTPIKNLGYFAVMEEHKKALTLHTLSNAKLIASATVDAVPLAMSYVPEHNALVSSLSDMTMVQLPVDDHMLQKRFQVQHVWPTIEAQMSLAWMPSNDILYSGSVSGVINAWKLSDRSLVYSDNGHSKNVMNLLALNKLDNLVSASLDTTIGVWDTYTNAVIHKLKGHRKGVFSLSYNSDFRLLASCGFDHDAFVWSPFVNSLVYKLKGHHASLVGVQNVADAPEIITADEDGVFKLWDIRTFQCLQTFVHNPSTEIEVPEKLSYFFHSKIMPRNSNPGSKEESRIFAGSRKIYCFDQKRIVHQRTTDFSSIIWLDVNFESSLIITCSDRNIIVWDMLLGSKTLTHENICQEEISACCLDDRKRKIIIGDVTGRITVYNPLNGAYMKATPHDIFCAVNALFYINDSRQFVAGYANSVIRLYDESKLDDCSLIRVFDMYNIHPELVSICIGMSDHTIITSGPVGSPIKLWDYETGKCDMELQGCDPKETVVLVVALDPFPLLVTSDSRGNIIIWGSRGCRWRGSKITGFLNLTPVHAIAEEQMKPTPGGFETPRRIVAPDLDDSSDDGTQTQSGPSITGPGAISFDDNGSYSTLGVDLSCDTSMEAKISREAKEGEAKWGPLAAATAIAWDPVSYYMYTGDELGNVRKWSLQSVIEDLGGPSMAHGAKPTVKPMLPKRNRKRDGQPAMNPVGSTNLPYMLQKKNAISFMGVNFCWSIQAHSECLLVCRWTPEGILTSATDHLVKMWSFEGRPIGVLLHSISPGVRSVSWDVSLDVETIMQRENKELDLILEKVKDIAVQHDSDHLNDTSMYSIDDEDSAKFSRSSLRKRIEMSGRILGLSFNDPVKDTTIRPMRSVQENDEVSVASTTSKSTRCAIEEMKALSRSTDTNNGPPPSDAMIHRKTHAMAQVTEAMKAKGIKLPRLSVYTNNDNIDDTPLGHRQKNSALRRLSTQDSRIARQSLLHPNTLIAISKSSKRYKKIESACSKYSTFTALEKTLTTGPVSPEFREAERERRRLSVLAMNKAEREEMKMKSEEASKMSNSMFDLGADDATSAANSTILTATDNTEAESTCQSYVPTFDEGAAEEATGVEAEVLYS